MDDQILKQLQSVQIEILEVIVNLCTKNNIRYSLYGGTLLGAVRHKGFIPWDDDLDICMPRDEYNRFISIWNNSDIKGYVLQNKENSPAFSQSFTKIRKRNTTFLESESARGKYHNGVFVDVFPIDRIPDGKFKRLVFQWQCLEYQLMTREYSPPKSDVIIRIAADMLLHIFDGNKRKDKREKLLRKITKWNQNPSYDTIGIEALSSIRKPLPAGLFDELCLLPFEGREYSCFKNWDEFLKIKYGDYMQLPPEDQRTWIHHPIVLDFEHEIEVL